MGARFRLIAVALLLMANAAWAQDPGSARGMLDFARNLADAGEGYRAATEYMRVINFFGDDREATKEALAGLGNVYAQAGRWQDAIGVFANLNDNFPSDEAGLKLGYSLYRSGDNENAVKVLGAGGQAKEKSAIISLAWIKSGSTGAPPANADASLVEQYSALPQKSPLLAGSLSAVLPGAGHLYVDRPRDALVAFLLNGLFIWGTVSAIQNDQPGLAGILGGMEALWYSGTVVGSVNGAHKWNMREKDNFFDAAQARWAPKFSLLGTNGGGGITATLDY